MCYTVAIQNIHLMRTTTRHREYHQFHFADKNQKKKKTTGFERLSTLTQDTESGRQGWGYISTDRWFTYHTQTSGLEPSTAQTGCNACNSSIWEVVSYIQSLRSAWVRGSLREAAGVAGHIRVHFVLITVAGEWIQPRCPSTEGWIVKMWCIYTMGFYSAVQKNKIRNNITQSPNTNTTYSLTVCLVWVSVEVSK